MSDMNQQTDTGSAPKPRRWLGPAFLASAALNIFLIAVILAPLVLHWRPGPPPDNFGDKGPRHGIFGALRELPPEDRKLLRQSMRDSFREMRPYLRKAGSGRKELAAAIAADPFDPDKVRTALAGIDAPMDEVRKIGQTSFIDTLEKMTPEQRKHVAEKIGEERHPRWERDDDDDRKGPPPPEKGEDH